MDFCRYVRLLCPAEVRLHFVLDNFSGHQGQQVRDRAHDNNVELVYTPHFVTRPTLPDAPLVAGAVALIASTRAPELA